MGKKSVKSRRDFLRITAGATGAALGMSLMPGSIRKALAIPAHRATGTIQDVQHVVILMQENRSFDHYFGSLRGVRGFGDPRPALLPNGKPVWYQPTASTKTGHYHSRGLAADASYVLPFYINPRETTEYQAGTDHGWSSGHLAWNGGLYNQWVEQKQDVLTMGHLKREDVSFHYALADAFTVCDSCFCSVHADTAPNRIYLWSGTNDPRNVLGRKPNGPGLWERAKTNGYTWTTYPERLEANKISWRLYQGGTGVPGTPTDNYTDNSLEFFAQYQVEEGASPESSLVKNGVSNHTLRDFSDDVMQGRLPQVSWIVAPYKYCEHPEASPTDGAYFINLVLEALTENPEVWSKTVFIINYDENDGLFDHVVPPMPPLNNQQNADGLVSKNLAESLQNEFLDLDHYPHEKHPLVPGADPGGLQPIGLGPRVPMLIVSPWTKGGWVCSQVFDHTSVLQFLETRFGVQEPNISQWRRSICGDLTAAFDFSAAHDTPPAQFTVPKPIASLHRPYHVPEKQAMPVQEQGTRSARRLPYNLHTSGRVDAAQRRFWIDFANRGSAGAAFYVYNRNRPDDPPRRYAVAAGDEISDYWTIPQEPNAYRLSVYGPNGHLCEFQGGADVAAVNFCEVGIQMNAQEAKVQLLLKNEGSAARTLRVVNAYSKDSARTYRVAPGAQQQDAWSVEGSAGWYDITITLPGGQEFLRRFAGHLELQQGNTSDPGPLL